MQTLKLKSLRMVNFMTYHDRTFDFADRTVISGKNGKGKTSIVTAYLWLMFNCDYQLNDNPKIRREIGEKPVNDMDVEVTAVFDMDGREVTARKVQKRTIGKDGTSYKDDNSYFINDVPKTLKAFNEYFEVNMKTLLMRSNINAFLEKKPKEVREYIFSKIKAVTDLDVARTSKALAELVPLLEQYTRDELEAMNKATKTRVSKEIPVLDGQIKEKERDVTADSGIDVAELELLRNSLKEQIAENRAKQDDTEKQLAEWQALSDGVLELKFQLNGLQQKADAELTEKRREIQGKIDHNTDLLMNISEGISRNNRDIARYRSDAESDEKERNSLADKWEKINSEEFDENTAICPTCHRPLPSEERERLLEEFKQSKAERIEAVNARGLSLAKSIETANDMITKLEECNKDNSANKERLEKEVEELERRLLEIPKTVDISDTEEYKSITAQIAEKEQALQNGNSAQAIRQQLKAEEEELIQQLSDAERKITLADKSKDEERLEELRQEKLDLVQSKADAEKVLYLLDELDKAKNTSLSAEVNSLFNIVEWQLFDYNKSGGYVSCCIPKVDGKSLLDIRSNKAKKLIGKLDICNSIQRLEGVQIPIFIDDTEALDSGHLEKALSLTDCQIVALKVTDDEELNVRCFE